MRLQAGAPAWTICQLSAEDAVTLGVSDSVSVVCQTRDDSVKWLDRRTIKSVDASWRFAVRGLRKPARIIFFGPYGARQAWGTVGIDRRDAVASLASAQHSRLGSLDGTFSRDGSTSLDVAAGDTLVLTYKTVAADSASALDWFLLVGPTGSEVSTPTRAHSEVRESGAALPTTIALRQNQPNPFSLTTEIRFDLPAEALVRLRVFDLQGRRVATLVDGLTPAGFRTVWWDRRDANGTHVKPGVYLYRLEAGSFHDQKKMLILP